MRASAICAAVTVSVSCVVLLATPGSARAATPTGKPVADISLGSAGKGLRASGVKVSPIKPLLIRSGKAGFPITDVAVNGSAAGSLVLRGGLILKRGKKSVRLTGMLISIRSGRVNVTGRIGRKRATIFTGPVSGSPTFDSGRIAVAVRSNKLSVTSSAARVIRKALRSRAPKSRFAGQLVADASVIAPPFAGGETVTPEEAAKCKTPGGPIEDPSRPVTAVDLTCGFFTWHVRDSWIQYLPINAPISPAVALSPIPGNQHVCPTAGASVTDAYSFSLKFTGGWWDASSGNAALFSSGGIHFRYDDHGLNIQVLDAELRIDGGLSTLKLTIIDSANPGGTRIDFANVNTGAPLAGGPPAPGTAATRLRTNLTSTGANAIGNGIYGAGDGFGCVEFGFDD